MTEPLETKLSNWKEEKLRKKEQQKQRAIERKLMRTSISKERLETAKLPVGRPKNDTGRLEELKARLLATKGTAIIDKVLNIALDDKHPGQMAAIKLCLDRMLPVSIFEKGAGVKPSIQINIVNTTDTTSDIDIQAVDVTDVDIDNE